MITLEQAELIRANLKPHCIDPQFTQPVTPDHAHIGEEHLKILGIKGSHLLPHMEGHAAFDFVDGPETMDDGKKVYVISRSKLDAYIASLQQASPIPDTVIEAIACELRADNLGKNK